MRNTLKTWLYSNLGLRPEDCQQVSGPIGQPALTHEGAAPTPSGTTADAHEGPWDVVEVPAWIDRDGKPDDFEEERQLVGDSLNGYDENDEDDDFSLLHLRHVLSEMASLRVTMEDQSVRVFGNSEVTVQKLLAAAADLKVASENLAQLLATSDYFAGRMAVIHLNGIVHIEDLYRGLRALDHSVLGLSTNSIAELMLQLAMFYGFEAWMDMHEGGLPELAFDEEAAFCGPGNAPGAEFVYRALRHTGWDCTRDDVRAQFDAVLGRIRRLCCGDSD